MASLATIILSIFNFLQHCSNKSVFECYYIDSNPIYLMKGIFIAFIVNSTLFLGPLFEKFVVK